MEVQLRIRRPEAGVDKIVWQDRATDSDTSPRVSARSLLWLSSQYADPAARTGDIGVEIDNILDKLAEVSANGGTSLDQALRIRAQFRRAQDVQALAGALRSGSRPPRRSSPFSSCIRLPGPGRSRRDRRRGCSWCVATGSTSAAPG